MRRNELYEINKLTFRIKASSVVSFVIAAIPFHTFSLCYIGWSTIVAQVFSDFITHFVLENGEW